MAEAALAVPQQVTIHAINFVRKIIDVELNNKLFANAFIPSLASMYAFVVEKFAHLFSSLELDEMKLEDAFEVLTRADKQQGYYLLRKFLVDWERIAKNFIVFTDNVDDEVTEDDIIPVFTDRNGDRPIYMRDIVETKAPTLQDKASEYSCKSLCGKMIIKLTRQVSFTITRPFFAKSCLT